MIKSALLIGTALLLLNFGVKAQTTGVNNYPKVGYPCPDFTLEGVLHYPKKNVSIRDFRGKWLIIDFWTRGCSTCFESFPETNKLKKEFQNNVEFLLVGFTEQKNQKVTQDLYEKFRKRYNLELPVAFDSALYYQFGVTFFPHVVWIDDQGIVRAITTTQSLNSRNIRSFLDGKDPRLTEKINESDWESNPNQFNSMKPLLINGNGGNDTDFYIRSVLTGWKRGVNSQSYISNEPTGFRFPNSILITNSSLGDLYETAFGDTIATYMLTDPGYGKWWTKGPILETSDTLAFKYNSDNGKNLYCYNLIVTKDKANKISMQKIMQQDLQHYFRFKVSVEKRIMPYWKLTSAEEAKAKLKSKGGPPDVSGDFAGIKFVNQPVKRVIRAIWGAHQSEPPYFDETGITGNIDLVLNCILTDFTDLKKELSRNGLDLIKSEKEMNVIVVRDPEKDNAKNH